MVGPFAPFCGSDRQGGPAARPWVGQRTALAASPGLGRVRSLGGHMSRDARAMLTVRQVPGGYTAVAVCRHGEHGVAVFPGMGIACTAAATAAHARRAHGAEHRCCCCDGVVAQWPDGRPLQEQRGQHHNDEGERPGPEEDAPVGARDGAGAPDPAWRFRHMLHVGTSLPPKRSARGCAAGRGAVDRE